MKPFELTLFIPTGLADTVKYLLQNYYSPCIIISLLKEGLSNAYPLTCSVSCCITAPLEGINHGHITVGTLNMLHWSFPLLPSRQNPSSLHQLTQHLCYSLLQKHCSVIFADFQKGLQQKNLHGEGYETAINMFSNLQKQNPILCKQDSTN